MNSIEIWGNSIAILTPPPPPPRTILWRDLVQFILDCKDRFSRFSAGRISKVESLFTKFGKEVRLSFKLTSKSEDRSQYCMTLTNVKCFDAPPRRIYGGLSDAFVVSKEFGRKERALA